jgi:hypothetical protein
MSAMGRGQSQSQNRSYIILLCQNCMIMIHDAAPVLAPALTLMLWPMYCMVKKSKVYLKFLIVFTT